MSHMKRALLVLLLAGGCGGVEYEPAPDVMGAWREVFSREDDPPNLWPATGSEMEHRHGMEVALVRDLSAEELAHALTHVWVIRQVREASAVGDVEPDRWHGDPGHTWSVWIANGQPAALERAALEYLQTRR
jgi:hypothetical protein